MADLGKFFKDDCYNQYKGTIKKAEEEYTFNVCESAHFHDVYFGYVMFYLVLVGLLVIYLLRLVYKWIEK